MFVVVYLDVIVVYRKIFEDHVMHLRLALEKIREHKIYLKPKNCKLGQKEVEFLAHIIGYGDIKMDPKKI